MKPAILFVAGLLFTSKIVPQSTFPVFPAVSVANASVADTSTWVAFQNPACLAYSEKLNIGLLAESRYKITIPTSESLTVSIPSDIVNTGISLRYSGFSVWHDMYSGLAFARNFSDKFALGLQLCLNSTYAFQSDSYYHTFLVQSGLLFPVGKNLHIGFQVFNMFNTSLKASMLTYPLPAIYSLGCNWRAKKGFNIKLQADKESGHNYRFAGGVDYQHNSKFLLQMGVYGFEYAVPVFGLGFHQGKFMYRLNNELHPMLGLITRVGVSYSK
jgi:hypothetical protein